MEEEEEEVVGPAQGRRRGGAETEAARGEKAEQVRPAGASRGRRRSAAAGAMATRIMSWGGTGVWGEGACGNGGLDWKMCAGRARRERERRGREAQSSPMSHGTGHGAGAQFLAATSSQEDKKPRKPLHVQNACGEALFAEICGGIQITMSVYMNVNHDPLFLQTVSLRKPSFGSCYSS